MRYRILELGVIAAAASLGLLLAVSIPAAAREGQAMISAFQTT